MAVEDYFSIGQVSEICDISRKTLRYYDEIGLVSPDKICENNYRYYSKENMLLVPVIRYYKQMGFKLEEMRQLLFGGSYQALEDSFTEKLCALKEQEMEIHHQYVSIQDWYDLLREAEQVIADDVREVAVKFVEHQQYLCYPQQFTGQYLELIINIGFANFVKQLNNKIKGPIVLCFPSLQRRLEGEPQPVLLMQKTILPAPKEHTVQQDGGMMLSCYHIGAHEALPRTYQKMLDWAERHHYQYQDLCYERYVTDYWSSRDPQQFVTELLIPIQRKK